ncbi:DUF3530 family protein [Halopseudomonas pachastrellae]|uniref:DUF3530 family protein n=1 Tax=Halopseudomonas pachastrellae TaxID=254161 RepID=UPI003D7E10E0
MRLPALIALLCLVNHAVAQEPEPDAGAISAPSERVDALSRSALYRDVLQRETPTEEQRQLEFNSESLFGLFLPAARPEPLGGVLLIAGAGEHADWPELIGPARRQLSDAGWHTLAITLPDAPDGPTIISPPIADPANQPPAEAEPGADPAMLAGSEPADDPAPAVSLDYGTAAGGLITAALQVLQAEGAEQISLVARRDAGYWALLATDSTPPEQPPQAMVLFEARQPAAAERPSLSSLLEGWDKPMLEMLDRDSPLGQAQAAEHLRVARRAGHNAYRQLDLAPIQRSAVAQEMIGKRLQGWLEANYRPAQPTPEAGETP